MATLTNMSEMETRITEEQADSVGTVDVTLRVDGMHCGSCIRRVTQAIHGGVGGAGQPVVKEVRLGAAWFSVAAEREAEEVKQVIAALSKAGFAARVDE